MTKICIEQVEGGFSVYAESDPAAAGEGMAAAPSAAAPTPPAAPQTVATVDEALQLAGSMLGAGGADQAQQDDASAEALFQSGYQAAAKQ